jgi:hypothetical protein
MRAGRRTCLLGINCGEQLLHGAPGWCPERLVELDRLCKLLADEVIAPREFAVPTAMLALAEDAALARLMIAPPDVRVFRSRGRGHARAASNGLRTPDILETPTKHRRHYSMPQPRRHRHGPLARPPPRAQILASRRDGCTEAITVKSRLHQRADGRTGSQRGFAHQPGKVIRAEPISALYEQAKCLVPAFCETATAVNNRDTDAPMRCLERSDSTIDEQIARLGAFTTTARAARPRRDAHALIAAGVCEVLRVSAETRLRGWACEIRSAPGDRQGVGGASPLR